MSPQPSLSLCLPLDILCNGKETKMNAGGRFTLKTAKDDVIIIIAPWDMAKRGVD